MKASILPPLTTIPRELVTVNDYEHYAAQRVSPAHWAYLNGGAAAEQTLQENQKAFQEIHLNGRVLSDMRDAHTRLTLFGDELDHPIILAPVAYQQLAHTEGELATVTGAGAVGACMVVSTQSSTDLDDIARRAHAPLWFQLYMQPDRRFTQKLLQRAVCAGYRALVVTVDAAVNGLRNREQRLGFRLPAHIEAVNLRGMQAPVRGPAPPGAGPLFGSGLLNNAPTWSDLEWLVETSALPVIVKGIMCVNDARRAQDAGVAGIIVSNHGGRTLDGLPPSLDALPGIASAVGRHLPVLLDGGIRRGSDIFKALALGARAVLIGRPYIYGLATAGAPGVAHIIQLLRSELEVTMALTGCPTLPAIGPSALWSDS